MARNKIFTLLALSCSLVLIVSLTSCQSSGTSQTPKKTVNKQLPSSSVKPSNQQQKPGSKLDSDHQEQFNKILDLARKDQWDAAEAEAAALYAMDPKNPSVQRIYNWVKSEKVKRQESKMEDEIRNISAKDSRFNPTVKSLLTDKPDKGLEPRPELREAIEKLKSTPYVPETFGKTIEVKGTLDDFESSRGRMSAILDKEISIQLDNVTLETIIFNIGKAEGINFIADKSLPAFQQKLSVNMKNVKLSEFLRYVSRNLGVRFQVGSDLVWIVDGKDPTKALEETRFYKLRRGFVIPAQFALPEVTKTTVFANNVKTETEVQKFNNFVPDDAPKTPSIENAIKQFFEGKYYIDYERNIIVARGTQEQLEVLEKIIDEFDKPIKQVLIEARFITVSEAMFMRLGAVWEYGRDPLTLTRTPTDYTGLNQSDVGLGLQKTWLGILGRKNLSATLTAIQQSGESEVLSSPRVTLINNLPATISDGKVQYYYEEYTVTQTILERRSTSSLAPKGTPTKLDAGVKLDVLASIGGDGQSIMLALNPEVNTEVKLVTFATIADHDDQGKVSSTFDIRLPEMRKQSVATRVVVKSGQTVVLGGVMERQQTTYVESVPVLSRIPIIGTAFRRRTELDTPRYLLIFVTATLLSESGEFIIAPEVE